MTVVFANMLFCDGLKEPSKLDLINRHGASISAEDFAVVLQRLRADCRFYRLTAALVNVSKNEQIAIDELLSRNAFSPAIVAGFKWLYTTENKGFISENFVKHTLPGASSSSQKVIVSKISKWVTNTDLGDKLWRIVRLRSIELSWMLLGACGNDLIMKQIVDHGASLELTQMLDILKKRFDSGIELMQKLADCSRLKGSRIDRNRVYRLMLKTDVRKGMRFLTKNEIYLQLGRKLSSKIIKAALLDAEWENFLLRRLNYVHHMALVRYASPQLYLKCFLEKFKSARAYSEMLTWLKHLRDDDKLKSIEAWFQKTYGSRLVDHATEVPYCFLYLLNEAVLKQVVDGRVASMRYSGPGTCELEEQRNEGLLFWQSMLPCDYQSFEFQMKRLECVSQADSLRPVRATIYNCILKSVLVLKRPQYLAKRLAVLNEITCKDVYVHTALVKELAHVFRHERCFKVTADVWFCLKELIDLRLRLPDESIHSAYEDLLIVCLEKVAVSQRSLLSSIMSTLNQVLVLRDQSPQNLHWLSKDKRMFFWSTSLAYREDLDELTAIMNGRACPAHLHVYFTCLATHRSETQNLISSFPKTLRLLKLIICPKESWDNFMRFSWQDVKIIFLMIRPLLAANETVQDHVLREVGKDEIAAKKLEALKAFRKSKIITHETRDIYMEKRLDRHFHKRFARSLLHTSWRFCCGFLKALDDDISIHMGKKQISATVEILVMVMDPSQLKVEVESLYPEDGTIDLNRNEAEAVKVCKRIAWVRALRYFGDTSASCERLFRFMLGDYIKHVLSSFHVQVSRLPTGKLASVLCGKMLNRESPVSSRKSMLRAFFRNSLMYDDVAVYNMVRQISVENEHDRIKRETLVAVYRNLKNVGEPRAWPQLKTCLGSMVISDRTTFTLTLAKDTSIDKHLPVNLEHVLRHLLNFSETKSYYTRYYHKTLNRIANNLSMLCVEFVLEIFDRLYNLEWYSIPSVTNLVRCIVFYCVPNYATILKSKLINFGDTTWVDFSNSRTLAMVVGEYCLADKSDKSVAVIEFLITVFTRRCSENFRELLFLESANAALSSLPEDRDDNSLLASLPHVTRKALRVTVGYLEKFGKEFFSIFVHDLALLMKLIFPKLTQCSTWRAKLLQIYNVKMSAFEILIFLKFVALTSPGDIWRSTEMQTLCENLEKHHDLRVKTAWKFYLLESGYPKHP